MKPFEIRVRTPMAYERYVDRVPRLQHVPISIDYATSHNNSGWQSSTRPRRCV